MQTSRPHHITCHLSGCIGQSEQAEAAACRTMQRHPGILKTIHGFLCDQDAELTLLHRLPSSLQVVDGQRSAVLVWGRLQTTHLLSALTGPQLQRPFTRLTCSTRRAPIPRTSSGKHRSGVSSRRLHNEGSGQRVACLTKGLNYLSLFRRLKLHYF